MGLQRAQRRQVPLKVGFSGPSGSGKTYSALLAASGIAPWNKIAVIDTENQSAALYDHLGGADTFFVYPLAAPFEPETYIKAISECEKAGMQVIIIDSITHEWDGKGGCLEIQERIGGRYQDWAKVTPRHRAFVDAILNSPCHVFTTVRRKQDYDMSNDGSGKVRVTKVGTKEITREGFEYELTVSFELTIQHQATASKDRTGIFMDKPGFLIDANTGRQLAEWSKGNASGPAPAAKVAPVEKAGPVAVAVGKEEVRAALHAYAKRNGGTAKAVEVMQRVAGVAQLKEVKAEKYQALLVELKK